ncbi:oligosaccharide flippase family protein [Thermodesulfovibrio yellowstonii]|uniref:Polysaccharide biosynthesis protein n=1 Tax=Thermodesulfovibrio yellowstonii TaxID=28262 RepID=A0A9W6GHF3_9BACT|nr:oligosaccharide flippase family protein [Thermodesulfovibrio islandicus]GLI54052.1 hypothetical protein TISLANDTSLP1_17450 [Thermodesulfovibrio islandicus]
MFKNISYVTVAFIYINILGYFFHAVVSRNLGPVQYGEFMVLYSFMLTVGNITSLLGAVSIKIVVENFVYRYELLRSLRKLAFFIGTMFAISICLGSLFLKNFLHVTQLYYFFIIALSWFGMFMVTVEKSFLQSTNRFHLFAFSSIFELTLRFFAAVLLLFIGLKVGGVLLASTIALFCTLIFLFYKNKNFFGQKASLNIKNIIKTSLYISPSGFFVYADDIFIRRIFDWHTAGLFASVSIVGKVLVWLTITILGVYFPEFVKLKNSGKFKNVIFQMFGIVVLAEILAQLVIFITGKPLFLLLFGYKFEPAVQFLPYYFWAILPLLFNIVFISIATALERGFYLIYLHLIFYYSGFILISFNSVYDYFKYIFLINLIFFTIYACFFRKDVYNK